MTRSASTAYGFDNPLSRLAVTFASPSLPVHRYPDRQYTFVMPMPGIADGHDLSMTAHGPVEAASFATRVRVAAVEAMTDGRGRAAGEVMRAGENPSAPDVPLHTRHIMQERLARTFRIEDIAVAGPTQRFAVDGVYPDGRTKWDGYVFATCPAEAGFRGAMEMAGHMVGHDQPYGRRLARVDEITISAVTPEPMSGMDYAAVLRDIVAEARQNGYHSPTLDKAQEMLHADEWRPEEVHHRAEAISRSSHDAAPAF